MALKDKEAHRAYCRAYYYAHSGKDRERRPRLTREESLARKRARSVEYRRKNKDKIRAYKARPDVRARHNAHNKAWREKNRDYMREYMKAYMCGKVRPRIPLTEEQIRARHERIKAYKREYARKHRGAYPEYYEIYGFLRRMKLAERMFTDADFYARQRRKWREYSRRRREKAGLPYKPRPSMRIPDWCVRGGVLDRRSQWIWENATDEQKAYARELFIERKEQRRAR